MTRLGWLAAVPLAALAAVVPTAAQAAPVAPEAHWSVRTVYVVNHAGSRWPVAAAVAEWNRAGVVHLELVPACTGYGCVFVWDAGRSSYDGLTWAPSTRRHVLTSATVRLYNAGTLGGLRRREVAMHELGHAIGLVHDTSRSSVMYRWTHPQWAPSAADYRHLAAAYVGVPR